MGIQIALPKAYNKRFWLDASAAYRFQSLKDQNNSRDYEISWHEYTATLGGSTRMGNLEFSLGGYYINIDGEEVVSGDINHNLSFEGLENTGTYAALGILLDKRGKIGIQGKKGAIDNFTITFARYY